MSPEQLAAWVARSRAAQGLSVKVTDPAAVRQVVVLVRGRSGSGVGPLGVAPTTTPLERAGGAQVGGWGPLGSPLRGPAPHALRGVGSGGAPTHLRPSLTSAGDSV
jgi:hypothetical protein